MKMLRYYRFSLPVFKQGDDLAHHLKESGGLPAPALLGLAEQYEEAAAMCRRLAGVAVETPGFELDADCHHIGVSGPEEVLSRLAVGDEALLDVEEWEDEGWDDEDDGSDENENDDEETTGTDGNE